MIRLVVLGGTGDVYLICALADAFRRHHGRAAQVVLRSKFSAVADLFFGERYALDDELVTRAENDPAMQRSYDQHPLAEDRPFFAHPCFVKSPTRVDIMTARPDASQADMYRMILHLPIETPLRKPTPPHALVAPNSVLLITDAVSWPNTQPKFWTMLEHALRASGRAVTVNDKRWPLGELLRLCAASEWVIAPQCGVMSILCTGEFPCRKTLATPSIDEDRAPGFLALETYPYAYVTKFANDDYDVEEFKVSHDNRAEVVDAIVHGQNAQRLWPHDPRPVITLQAPMSPGDALDRLAVLTVKRDRFNPQRRAMIEREYRRYMEITRGVRAIPKVHGFFARLVVLHEQTFDLLERMVPAARGLAPGGLDPADHVLAVAANRERYDLKQVIDRACHAPYTEEKSYYDVPKG